VGRTASLLAYKVRFFFGPAFRGRFGPLVYLALIAIFVPSGFGTGFALGMLLKTADPIAAVNLLGTPLAAFLSIAFLYSLGAGVTAHPSEFDFFLTSDLRPRQYLVADLVFQLVTLLAAGGLTIGVAAIAMVVAFGDPLVTALPLLGLLIAYAIFVLMTSQLLVVLRVRHPKAPVRWITVALLVLSFLPALASGTRGFPIQFEGLPIPSTAFAGLSLSVLRGLPVSPLDVGVAALYLGAIGAAWFALSDTYIVHGIRPTLSAGFGQIDMHARLEMQQRLIGRLGGVTTRIRLRTDRGGETGLMTRMHLVRIWRDGSVLFVLPFAFIGILSAGLAGSRTNTGGTVTVTQTFTVILGILAMNWGFYERENLWIVLTAAKPPGAYFRGLMLSLVAIGLGTTLAFLAFLVATRPIELPIESLALPIASPIAGAFAATAALTRVKLKPSAFSFAVLGIFFLVSLGGIVGGVAAQSLVLLVRVAGGYAVAAQATVLFGFVLGLTAFGLWAVTRLAMSFRL